MDNSHFFDEELEEKFYEGIEKKMIEKEVEFLRNVLDDGWDIPYKLKLEGIM
jgi:hypothetical protein